MMRECLSLPQFQLPPPLPPAAGVGGGGVNEIKSLPNVPGVWPKMARYAQECLNDAQCHIGDFPLGRFAMIHRATEQEIMSDTRPSAIRWSIAVDDSSELCLTFSQSVRNLFNKMDQNRYIIVHLHLTCWNQSMWVLTRLFRR